MGDIDYVGLVYRTTVVEQKKRTAKRAARRLKIFLCHGSEDKESVRSLHRRLQDEGMQPWLDEWDTAIRGAIKNCDIVLVCLSSNSVSKTGYVQKEITFALDMAGQQPEGRVFIIPIRLDDDVRVPQRLSQWKWLDLFADAGTERLISALKMHALKSSRRLG